MTLSGVHERARRAWRTSIEEDDALASRARQQRLLLRNAVAPRPRWRVAPAMQLALGAAIGGLVAAAWLGHERDTNAPVASSVAPSLATSATSATSATGMVATGATGNGATGAGATGAGATGAGATSLEKASAAAAQAASPGSVAPDAHVVAGRSCAACTKNGAPIAAGDALDGASAVDVPRGATLLASWSLPGGLVDPRSSVDVVGPARVRIRDAAIVLEQGMALAETRGRGELHAGAGPELVITIGTDATWRIDVTPVRTRIDVTRGEVSVTAHGESPRSLQAGEHVEILPSAPPAGATAMPASTGALATPPSSPAAALPPPPDDRALLDAALAQLLATGNVAKAVASLNELARSRNDAVAFEAANALVRISKNDRERDLAWTGFLQRDRPSPSADIAMASLANVLLDLGNPVEASVWVNALASRPAVPEAAILADRARARLAERSAEECLEHDVRKLRPARRR